MQAPRETKFIRVTKPEKGGAVKMLENTWKFHTLSDGSTTVEFFVEVSLKAFPLNILMGAFERRAALVCKPIERAGLDLSAEYARLGLKA